MHSHILAPKLTSHYAKSGNPEMVGLARGRTADSMKMNVGPAMTFTFLHINLPSYSYKAGQTKNKLLSRSCKCTHRCQAIKKPRKCTARVLAVSSLSSSQATSAFGCACSLTSSRSRPNADLGDSGAKCQYKYVSNEWLAF